MPAARPRHLAALALALSACTPVERPAAPLDRYTFPTGIALHEGHLLVVSSNFDLKFEDDKGGSVLSVDPDAWIGGDHTFEGGLRVPSFGGEIVVAEPTACGLPAAQALFASRLSGELFRLGVGADGSLSCGEGCRVKIAKPGDADPFAVEVVCRPGKQQAARAFVGWLHTLSGTNCGSGLASSVTCGIISEAPLEPLDQPAPGAGRGSVIFGAGGIRKLRYDPGLDTLFFVSTGSLIGWIDLATECSLTSEEHACTVQSVNLGASIRGIEVRSLAASSTTPRRLYVAARIYDPDAAAVGVRVDLGGVLVVLALEGSATGGLDARVLRTIPLGTGISEVTLLPPRAGRRDVMALSATNDGEIWFYDDEVGAVTGVIGHNRDGRPVVGDLPYAIVAEDRTGRLGPTEDALRPTRLYVGAFGDGVVSVVDVNPDDPAPPADGKPKVRIGE